MRTRVYFVYNNNNIVNIPIITSADSAIELVSKFNWRLIIDLVYLHIDWQILWYAVAVATAIVPDHTTTTMTIPLAPPSMLHQVIKFNQHLHVPKIHKSSTLMSVEGLILLFFMYIKLSGILP